MSFIGKWKDKIAHYIDVRLSLAKLSVIQTASNVLSYLIYVFISLFLTIAILIFLGIGLGEWLSDLVDSRAGGYFMTAGIFILLMVLLVVLRTTIVNAFSGTFIRIMTEGDEEDEKYERTKT
ncbi:MAG: hypothetical protein EOO07_29495, partial [Chitinophagaceae bacterium]